MKLLSTQKLGRGARAGAFLVLPLALFAVRALGASDDDSGSDEDYRITVRSSVEQKYTTFSKEPLHHQGGAYTIISLDQVRDTPLIEPENERALYEQLRTVLSAYGFHEPAAGTNPDIVLTVFYGTGFLRNPYLDKTMPTFQQIPGPAHTGGAAFFGSMVTGSVEQIARERSTPGYEEKLKLANLPKLFIIVTAWKFPATPTEKPQRMWSTTMLVDDPGQDLNRISKKMLAAGARYFDRPMDKEEVYISSKVAEGYVKIGTPSVVDKEKPNKP